MQLATRNSVFIVEDSDLIRGRLVEMIAEIGGVEIVGQAGTPTEAVSGIFRTHPRSVVLDVQLLGGSGIDVMRAVHPREPGIRFIVLTNQSSPQYRSQCMAAGASYFLDKSSEFGKIGEILHVSKVSQHQHRVNT